VKPHISLITLGVADLDRSLRFYRDGLGLPTEGIVGEEFADGAVVFFELAGNLRLALFPRTSLLRDAGLAPEGGNSSGSFSLAHNVASPAAVDVVMREAAQAGAMVVKPAGETFWGGYAGCFQDPDGHLWEVAWNPQWTLPE